MLKAIQNSSRMMAFFLEDLLDSNLIENGKFTANVDSFNVVKALLEVIEATKYILEQKNNKIKLRIREIVPEIIDSDKNRFK